MDVDRVLMVEVLKAQSIRIELCTKSAKFSSLAPAALTILYIYVLVAGTTLILRSYYVIPTIAQQTLVRDNDMTSME